MDAEQGRDALRGAVVRPECVILGLFALTSWKEEVGGVPLRHHL